MRGVDREVLNLRLCSLHPYVVKFKEVRSVSAERVLRMSSP